MKNKMSLYSNTLSEFPGVKNIALWILQILIAFAFLAAGYVKLSGNSLMVESFGKIGFGQWFRYLTGAIEVVSAVMLLIPSFVPIGAFLLSCTMIGAIFVHLFVFHDSPLVPIILLFFNAVILIGRGNRLFTANNF